MLRSRWVSWVCLGLLACEVASAATAASATAVTANAAADRPPAPRLIVAVSIDQFGSNLYTQYRGTFHRGLKRLTTEGVVFSNGYQSHGGTETCPGHSTLLTGRHPSGTGIVANEWLDRETGKRAYCVYDKDSIVPGRPEKPRGPANLRVATLGEWLKTRDPASRTIAVAGKDRSAIVLAGHRPDAVFWWDDDRGFNTYVPKGMSEAERLAPVKTFNDEIDRQWSRKLPKWKPLGKSCAALEHTGIYDGLEIAHRVPPDWEPTGKPSRKLPGDASSIRKDVNFRNWVKASPVLDRLTLDLAAALIERYRLGRGPAVDVLAIGLSATDYVGHRYGTQGPEMCDQMAHLDRVLGRFLKQLDRLRVPYLLVLSADHGAVDAPERAVQRGFPAERVVADFEGAANEAIRKDMHLGFDPLRVLETGVYVMDRGLSAELRGRIVEKSLAYLQGRPEIAAAFSKRELLAVRVPGNSPPDELTLTERLAESVDAERSPDIVIVLHPYATLGRVIPENSNYIVGHGSPWNYDRRVPIIFWWPGAKGFEQALPVETVDIAPTLAAVVGLQAGVQMPPVDGRCLDLDRGEGSTCDL